MEAVFEAASYLEILDEFLHSPQSKNRRGVSKLADELNVHPTFISKVLQGKAHFSMEQSIAFCQFAKLKADETEYFVDLVNHDRAGNHQAKQHFAMRLRRHRSLRKNLRERLESSRDLTSQDQWIYFESWLPQAIHALCQTKAMHTVETISQRLRIDPEAVQATTDKLIKMDLIRADGKTFISNADFIHTGKDSPFVKRLHLNWRQKTISDLLTRTDHEGMHFTGVATMDAATQEKIHSILVQSLEQAKSHIAVAPPKQIYALAIDFYEL